MFGPSVTVAVTLNVIRDETCPPGAGIRLKGLDSTGEPLLAGYCQSDAMFQPVNFGGVVVNPDSPTTLGFATSPAYVVEGREYAVGWATAGGGDTTLDGVPVEPSGIQQFIAGSTATHMLNDEELQVSVIREPWIEVFEVSESAIPGRYAVTWSVQGSNLVSITGIGQVASSGSHFVDSSTTPILDIASTNEWGRTVEAIVLVPPTNPPSIDDFSLYTTPWQFGQPLKLNYATRDAVTVTITPEPGRVPIGSGIVEFIPSTTGTFTLTASNDLGSVNASLDVTGPAPRIILFHVDPDEFGPGDPISLEYVVEGADSVWLDPGGPLESSSGTFELVSPAAPTVYTLHASNQSGHNELSIVLTSLAPRLWVDWNWYRRDPSSTAPFTFSWSSQFADDIRMMPGSIWLRPTYGSRTITVEPWQTFTFVATNASGTTTVTKTTNSSRPAIIEFAIEPLPRFPGDEFEVVWETRGAYRVSVQGLPGFQVPASASPNAGRVQHVLTEPFAGSPRLIALGEGDLQTTATLDPGLMVVEPDRVIDYFHVANPDAGIGDDLVLHWDGHGYASTRIDGQPVPVKGSMTIPLTESTAPYMVLENTAYSPAVVDTAWIPLDSRGTLTLSTSAVIPAGTEFVAYAGEEITLEWSTPGASRASISPFVGDVDVGGGNVNVTVDRSRDFVLSAWYDGEREVIERGIHVSAPFIDVLEFSENPADPSTPVTLSWQVRGVGSCTLTRPDNTLIEDVPPIGSLAFDSPPYGQWRISASNSMGAKTALTELRAPYLEVSEFYADPPVVVLGETTTLVWSVQGASEVEILGLGTFAPEDGVTIYPQFSRTYELIGTGAVDSVYRSAQVRVDVDASRPPTIMVSGSPDEYLPELAPLPGFDREGSLRYEAWVRVEDILGAVHAVYYSLDLPDWLELLEIENSGYAPVTSRLETNYWVGFEGCLPAELNSRWITRVVVRQKPGWPSNRTSRIGIHEGPDPGSDFPKPPRWHACETLASFGLATPGMNLTAAPPANFRSGAVPVLALPLETSWNDRGLELDWSAAPDVQFSSLALYRGKVPGELSFLADITDRDSWIDAGAAEQIESGSLYYQLIGHDSGGRTWRSTELRVTTSPPDATPAHTRLIGARPNPFNPQTTIEFDLADPGSVSLTIYDLAGRKIRRWTLQNQVAGRRNVIWDGTDESGRRAASGVYFVQLQTEGFAETKRVTLLK